MTTTTELLTSESEGVNDTIRGFEFINLNKCLNKSFNEYLLYITEHELKLTRKEKNKLGIHFIIKELISVCSRTSNWLALVMVLFGHSASESTPKRPQIPSVLGRIQ